jgi:surface polysaccharide O-acyltransferase-like enzyme
MTERRHDIDALRVLGTAAVFLFHCGKFFDPGGWHLTNSPASFVVGRSIDATSLWLMPLFFLLSGISTSSALASRSALRLVHDRVQRLLVPFAFGVLVIVPPQVWAERVGHGAFHGAYWAFYPHYFEGLYGAGGNFAWFGMHLWYLPMLFLTTLLLLPALRSMTSRNLDSPWVLLVPIAIMSIVEIALIGHALDHRDLGGWSVVQYPLFFASGVALGGRARIRATLQRLALALLVIGVVAGGLWAWAPDAILDLVPRPVWRFARILGTWCMLYGFLGLADRYVKGGRWIAPLNEASMTFYILHQTAILLIALSVLPWNAPIPVKYTLLAALAFAATVAVTMCVMRVPLLRPLFGLKVRTPRGERALGREDRDPRGPASAHP